MRWILYAVVAFVLLTVAWQLLKFVIGAAFGILHLVVMLAIIVFLVGLARRLLVR